MELLKCRRPIQLEKQQSAFATAPVTWPMISAFFPKCEDTSPDRRERVGKEDQLVVN